MLDWTRLRFPEAKNGLLPRASTKLKEESMRKLAALVLAAVFAALSLQAVAQDKKDAKPTAEQCKKDPKMKGCDQMKK